MAEYHMMSKLYFLKNGGIMNKRIFFGIIVVLSTIESVGLLEAMQLREVSRAIPVAYDKNAQQWSILLGHNIGEYWNDSGTPLQRGERANKAAERALNEQTKGVFNIAIQGV